ncbi:transmembrane protein, putative [Bodo saltans]|uniref:Transmembrane protein, putative n=1 Tax=Bodo saltans TaxID=75058 RepID=A0A0S4KIE5_BODSA|nr:transmembrane protein, putative [Bodo saltans]|eukprot:CUI15473.1 transmembrane protein, putative [Bodo saltans]
MRSVQHDSTPNIVMLRSYASGSATPLGATLSTIAVTRDALASGDVMFSATIRLANGRGASCWTIPSVTLDGVALGFSTKHVLDANGVALIELLLPPPHRGDGGTWLPGGLNVYTDAQLNLNLALSCHDRAGEPFVSSLVVRVPCPGRTRDLVGAVATAVETLQWVSVISGPGASSSVARVAAMRSMQMCGSDGLKGIVQIPTSACGNDDNKSAEASRDGMTGNMVVIAASFTAGVLLCWLISVCSSAAYASNSPWYVAMRTIAFPSCFTPVLVVTLPTTIALSIVLITGPDPVFYSVDMSLGVIGMLVALAVTGAPVLLWRCSIGRLEVHPEAPNVQKRSPSPGGGVSSSQVQTWWIVRQWTRWTSIQRHWHLVVDRKCSFSSSSSESSKSTDRHTLTTAPPSPATFTWERHAALVLHEYHLLWYFVIDTAVLFVAGVLVGVTQSTPGTLVCGSCSIFVAVMYSAQFGLCFNVFPFTSFFGNVHGLLVLVLSAVSAILQATHIVLSSHTAYAVDHASALDQLMLASAVCDLMVMGTSGMRAVMDLIELALTIRRLASSFDPRGRHPPSGLLVVTSQRIDDDDNTTATSHSSDSDSVNASFNINIENSEDEKSEMSQAKFWDSEGMAMALLDEIAEEVIRPAAEEEQPDQYDEMLQAPVFDEPSPKVVDL